MPAHLPPWLTAVIMKAINKRPEERYGSAAQMARDLRDQHGPSTAPGAVGNPNNWTPQTVANPMGSVPTPPPSVFVPRRKAFRWPKLPRLSTESRVFAGALLGTLVLGLIIAWGIWACAQQYRNNQKQAAWAAVDAIRAPAVQAFNSGDYTRAVEGFRRVYGATRDETDRKNLVNAWIGLGLSLSGRDAEQSLNEALRLDPGNPVANYGLADLYYSTGNLPMALEGADAAYEALNTRPEEVNQSLRIRLAALYLNLGDAAHNSANLLPRADQDLWRTAERLDSFGPVGAAAKQRLSGGR